MTGQPTDADPADPGSRAVVQWVDARRRHPRDGQLVLAAITGRYPPDPGRPSSAGEDFWLVLPMHFRHEHPVDTGGLTMRDCYLDADQVIRVPLGSDGDGEQVTHWAALPHLPGQVVTQIVGAAVGPALTETHLKELRSR